MDGQTHRSSVYAFVFYVVQRGYSVPSGCKITLKYSVASILILGGSGIM
jgi:hypothetical protein